MEVESLFSTSKYIFDDRRLGTTPENVEQQMFLKENHFLWVEDLLVKFSNLAKISKI